MTMTPPPEPTLRLKVDQAALAANWRALNAMSGAKAGSGTPAAGAAGKADCYGLGVDACIPALRDAGCNDFLVAHWSEIASVAAHVPARTVAVLHGPMSDDDCAYARATGAVPVINSIAQARRWAGNGGGLCHVMIDTGINRLGITPEQLSDPAIAALEGDILMSHLASADEDSPANARQLEQFAACRAHITHRRASLANSAGIALGTPYAFDLTRPGIALYGGVPRAEFDGVIAPVARIEAAVIQTRDLKPGDRVGYNGVFMADHAMRTATVSIGYADGFLRARGPGGYLHHGGVDLPILGKVSMDMVVIDVTQAPDIGEGDWLCVPFDLPDAARQSSVSQYELLTVMGQRLRR